MTAQEAIKNIVENGIKLGAGYYVNVEALKVAVSALGKQIPKKPKSYLVNMKHIDFLCPNCKKRIISKVDGEWVAGKNQKFCDNCGQALDWSDKE